MSQFTQTNSSLRNKNYAEAIRYYIQAVKACPDLAHVIQPSLKLARQRYQKERSNENITRVG